MTIPGIPGPRRLNPRSWDSTAYLLRLLKAALRSELRKELSDGKKAVVIDLGCGDRPYEPLVKEQGADYLGVDITGNHNADYTHDADTPAPLDDGVANIVLSTQVLEHVVDVPAYLRECRRLLAPNGLLLISTHGVWNYHPYPVDVRRWTSWGLRHDIESGGFVVESMTACQGPLAYTTQLRLQLLRGFLWNCGPPGRFAAHSASFFAQNLMWLEDKITPNSVREQNATIYLVAARRREL